MSILHKELDTTKDIYAQRIKVCQSTLLKDNVVAIILSYSRDVYYYTRVSQPAILLIKSDSFQLFIKRGREAAEVDFLFDRKHLRDGNEKDVSKMLDQAQGGQAFIGLEMDAIAAETYLLWKALLPSYDFINISPLILTQRQAKDKYEEILLRKACEIADIGHSRVMEVLRDGISERELAIEIESSMRNAGDQGTLFLRNPNFFLSRVVLGSGPNLYKWTGIAYTITGVGQGPYLPVGPSDRIIRRGDLIIVDLGPCFNGYHADESRTYSIGKQAPNILNMFSALRDISDTIISYIKAGVECGKLYEKAVRCAEKHNMGDFFLKLGTKNQAKLVGHGIGLEVNEPPFISAKGTNVLPAGAFLAVEVHITHPEAVIKLEDDVLVTTNGAELITKTPRHLIEI